MGSKSHSFACSMYCILYKSHSFAYIYSIAKQNNRVTIERTGNVIDQEDRTIQRIIMNFQFDTNTQPRGQTPMLDHNMIRCNDATRLKWRRKYIRLIKQRMEYLETDFGLMETFCHAVTYWFDNEKVNIDKYPVKYHRALITQNNIGWRQIFMGRI